MLFVSNIPERPEADAIVSFIDQMPGLPISAAKALNICNQPDASPSALTRVVALDPVLTAQVLRLINSTYYALPSKVESLIRAVVMLGFNTIKNLVVSTIVVDTIRNQAALPSHFTDFFWHHSLCVGLMARALADFTQVPAADQEAFFVAGLLHDLGKIPLCQYNQDKYLTLWTSAYRDNKSIHTVENRLFGTNHNQAGGLIAEKWQLGKEMRQVLLSHHNVSNIAESDNQRLIIVSLADRWVNFLNRHESHHGFEEDRDTADLLSQTDIRTKQMANLWPKVKQQLKNAEIFLQI